MPHAPSPTGARIARPYRPPDLPDGHCAEDDHLIRRIHASLLDGTSHPLLHRTHPVVQPVFKTSRRSPGSTLVPDVTASFSTVPAEGALMEDSIFIASMVPS